ncbi:MAG: hypothetical protein KAX84_17215 [Burkholderiales bacterium]|nr:hypothetical protein [Burkholderiales bacterium]
MSKETRTVALRIDAGVLGFAAEFISTEETRYYLNGVYVEPAKEGVLAVATDGQRLIVVTDPKGFIARPAILRAERGVWAKCRTKYAALLTVEALGRQETPQPILAKIIPEKGPAETVIFDEIAGTFPEWRRVVPTDFPKTGVIPAFKGRYLAAFDGLARVGGRSGGVRVVSRGLREPAVVLPASGSAWPWLGVLMPIHGDDLPSAYPAWLGLAEKKIRVKAKTEKVAA